MSITVYRKAHFNAAHRLYRKDWDDKKNKSVFGKCSNPNFHGHNYELEVGISGTIDKETGFLIDIEKHKDKSKKIIFKKKDALSFVSKTKINFDLILIKQTIHLVKKNKINKLLLICKNKLNTNGKIIILSLDPHKNEIPAFDLMKKKLKQSLKRDKSLFQLIKKFNTNLTVKKFIFNRK